MARTCRAVLAAVGVVGDAACLTAASLWRFAPARLDGCPVMVDVVIEMSFRLR